MPKVYSDKEKCEIIARLKAEANELMQEKGVKKTTVDELVKRAGIPKGTFYLFYPSKEMLLFDCAQEFHGQVDEYISSGLKKIFGDKPNVTTDYSQYTDEVTDVVLGAMKITQGSCLKILLDPVNMQLVLSKLPQEVLEKHRQDDRDIGGGIIAEIAENKGLDSAALSGAFTMILFGGMYKQVVGEEHIGESTRLLVRGLVKQILE